MTLVILVVINYKKLKEHKHMIIIIVQTFRLQNGDPSWTIVFTDLTLIPCTSVTKTNHTFVKIILCLSSNELIKIPLIYHNVSIDESNSTCKYFSAFASSDLGGGPNMS